MMALVKMAGLAMSKQYVGAVRKAKDQEDTDLLERGWPSRLKRLIDWNFQHRRVLILGSVEYASCSSYHGTISLQSGQRKP